MHFSLLKNKKKSRINNLLKINIFKTINTIIIINLLSCKIMQRKQSVCKPAPLLFLKKIIVGTIIKIRFYKMIILP